MAVRIVTDSTSDIPTEILKELDITVVPVYVFFGSEEYRDGVDLTEAEFYEKMVSSPYHPRTSQPSPEDFANVYRKLALDTDGIVSIVISSKLSGVYNSAVMGKELANDLQCPIEVVDSKFNSIGLGLITMTAARLAKTDAKFQEVLAEAHRVIGQVKMLGVFDTLKYLVRGGRVSKIRGVAVNILGVKPLLTFRDGEVVQAGLARSYNKAVSKIVDFVKNNQPISELAIAHSSALQAAIELKHKLSLFLSGDNIIITELGPALGAHGGPGVLLVALRSAE
jgi:DegV family protein with EDD domain